MNQLNQTIYSSSSAHLINELIFLTQFRLIWFMNQVQRANCRVDFRTMFELDWFIASPNIIKK
jgi:hypothetical protein